MTPLKTWCLLHLSVLFIAPTVTEVVQSMAQCKGFLLNDKAPQVPGVLEKGQIKSKNRYKVICQTFKDVRRFVTLYDTKNKILVLSAYKFTGVEGGRPNIPWMMEPQLEDTRKDKNMVDSNETVYNNQASDKDYHKAGYDRGHLRPSSYANHNDDKKSTFTLTNAVPQVASFNQGSWARMETCVKCIMEKFCVDNNDVIKGYVMTGAKPSEINKIKNRVNVPSLLWSAFCCYSNKLNRWIASAYWGDNVRDKSDNKILHTRKLNQLYDELSKGDKRFEAFPNSRCPLDQTVYDLYHHMNETCSCVKNP